MNWQLAIEKTVTGLGYDLVDTERSPKGLLRVYIDKQGQTYIDGEPVQIWTLQSRIRDQIKGMTAKSVLVVTDELVPSGRLVEVVDQARLAGAEDIGVATSVEAGEG